MICIIPKPLPSLLPSKRHPLLSKIHLAISISSSKLRSELALPHKPEFLWSEILLSLELFSLGFRYKGLMKVINLSAVCLHSSCFSLDRSVIIISGAGCIYSGFVRMQVSWLLRMGFGTRMAVLLTMVMSNRPKFIYICVKYNLKNSRQKTSWNQINQIFFCEIAFLAVLYFFPVQKLIFGHFRNSKN